MLLLNLIIRRYASGQEIHAFYKSLAKEYGVYECTKFQHAIRRAEWSNLKNVWEITVENLQSGEIFVDEAEVFLNCGGALKSVKSKVEQQVPSILTKTPAIGNGRPLMVCTTSKGL